MSKKSVITPIYTKWGEQLDRNSPLSEYPRPQLERKSYMNLNGVWSYCITESDSFPTAYEGEIVVPFSPESLLSGVGKQLLPHQFLWYRRVVHIDEAFLSAHTLLNFGAVDQVATVYVNGEQVGYHEGGYTPFSCDCTNVLRVGDNEICVMVRDFSNTSEYAYAKQTLNRGGIWYTAQSGIWQTVWMESVPDVYVQSLKITPMFDEHSVKLEVITNKPFKEADVLIKDKGETVAYAKLEKGSSVVIDLGEEFIPWDTENPHLYDIELTVDEDKVFSYFGMRKFSTATYNGFNVLALNNKPIFHTGLLDQGYWSDGMLTPPSDEAMIYDIKTMKEYGFNMLRKHIKIEPLRWYYHCDRLGMLVWQDMVSGGEKYNPLVIQVLPYIGVMLKDKNYGRFGRKNASGRERFIRDCVECIDLLYNCVSLAVWVPFNEGWGQFDAEKIYNMFKQADPTRLTDHASGWHDQRCGDFNSKHVYYKKVRLKSDRRVLALSEFGGYSMPCEGNMASNVRFGYKIFNTKDEFMKAYKTLYEKEVIPFVKKKGLSASVYTQVSDVEDEINGLLTYDRRIEKPDKDILVEINQKLKDSFNN